VKFPFCFYEKIYDTTEYVALYNVRFRHQFHPDMNTNITYPSVYIDKDSWLMTVRGEDDKVLFKVEMELHLKPKDPNVN
jgi:hypothetical protein